MFTLSFDFIVLFSYFWTREPRPCFHFLLLLAQASNLDIHNLHACRGPMHVLSSSQKKPKLSSFCKLKAWWPQRLQQPQDSSLLCFSSPLPGKRKTTTVGAKPMDGSHATPGGCYATKTKQQLPFPSSIPPKPKAEELHQRWEERYSSKNVAHVIKILWEYIAILLQLMMLWEGLKMQSGYWSMY